MKRYYVLHIQVKVCSQTTSQPEDRAGTLSSLDCQSVETQSSGCSCPVQNVYVGGTKETIVEAAALPASRFYSADETADSG